MSQHRFSPDPDNPGYVMVDWRIPEFLGGVTYCLQQGANGEVELEDICRAIANEIDADYIAQCAVDVTRVDSHDPMRPLGDEESVASGLASTADSLIRYLRNALQEGLVLSTEQRDGFALLLRGVS